MPRLDTKQQPVVTIRIERGPVSPAQKQAWRRFCQKLVSEAKNGEQ